MAAVHQKRAYQKSSDVWIFIEDLESFNPTLEKKKSCSKPRYNPVSNPWKFWVGRAFRLPVSERKRDAYSTIFPLDQRERGWRYRDQQRNEVKWQTLETNGVIPGEASPRH